MTDLISREGLTELTTIDRAPRLGDRVRWSQRAGRFYFWDTGETFDGDPDSGFVEPRVSTRDGIPDVEKAKLVEQLSISDEWWQQDGQNLNSGSSYLHVWDEPGEGVLIGKTSRTVFTRTQDDNSLAFTGMSPGKTTQFWEVKVSLRGRRIIVPLESLEVLL